MEGPARRQAAPPARVAGAERHVEHNKGRRFTKRRSAAAATDDERTRLVSLSRSREDIARMTSRSAAADTHRKLRG